MGTRGSGVSGGRRGRVAGRSVPRGGHLHAAVRRVVLRRALRRAPGAETPATATRPLAFDLLRRARRPDSPPGASEKTRREATAGNTCRTSTRPTRTRGGRSRATARRSVCVTTRDATVENHRDGQSAKTDDVDDRRRTTGASMMDDAFQPCATPRPATRGCRSRSNITTRTVPPPSLSPSPSRSLHHVVVVEHFPGFVLVPPPRSSRGGCVSSSGDDGVPDPLGHPRMPRRSKRPRRRAALLHP